MRVKVALSEQHLRHSSKKLVNEYKHKIKQKVKDLLHSAKKFDPDHDPNKKSQMSEVSMLHNSYGSQGSSVKSVVSSMIDQVTKLKEINKFMFDKKRRS